MKRWLPEELEKVTCDSCGSTGVSHEFVRADGMHVVECSVCGLAYLNPRPKPDFIQSFYETDYFTGVSADRGDGGLRCNMPASNEHHPDAHQKFSPVTAIVCEKLGGWKSKNVLEIGCATGDLLEAIQKEGARVKGIELSEYAASIARERGINVETGTIEDFVIHNHDVFDVVIAFEVIEHLPSPANFLRMVSQLIRSGGIFLVSTPNYVCSKRFGEQWYGFRTSFEHMYYFTSTQLIDMSHPLGLTCEHVFSSLFLGGPLPGGFVSRQREKIKNLVFFASELGLNKTIRALIQKKKSRYYAYPIGHTLHLAFRKRPELVI